MPSDDTPSTSGRTRCAVRLAAGVGVLGLVLSVWRSTIGFGSAGAESSFTTYVYPLLFLSPTALLFLRTRARGSERLPWALLGAAYMLWATAFLGYNASVAEGDQPSIPSLADAGWLAFYPLAFFGFVGLVRARATRLTRGAWLDGLTAALALAALAAVLLVDPVVSAVDAEPLAVATLLAYPLGDVALALVVLTIGTHLGWRPGGGWLLIAAALVLQVGAHVSYAYAGANGTWQPGTLVDALWLWSALLVAWAAWRRPAVRPRAAEDTWQVLAVPSVFAMLSLGIVLLGSFMQLGVVPNAFAAAAVMVSLARAVTTVQEKRVLGDLALRDPLTGLLNHGAFHAELEAEVARDAADRFSVVLLDLDGFKQINDLRGHAEGDRVLREVAAAIEQAPRAGDVTARVGGDEFALLLRGADGPGATAVAQRVREIVRERGVAVDASFGVATWPADGPSKSLLLLRADTALYAAKNADRETRKDDPDRAGARMRGGASELERARRDLERAQLRSYAEDVRNSYVRELQRSQELKESYLATVRTLAAAVEAKDEYTGYHIQRVHALGLLLARAVVPQQADDPQLSYGLLLHDVGKLSVPDAILNKPGKLDEREWELMKRHPERGVRILSAIPFLGRALDVVRHHHERWDGTGYPDRLRGEQIPLWARMFAIVDTVDAITSDRPYRRGRPLEVAVAELRKAAGGQFDPACVQAFERLDPRQVEALLERRADSFPEIAEIAGPELAIVNRLD